MTKAMVAAGEGRTALPAVSELEAENARLRLLVSELLVMNQRLREESKALQGDQGSFPGAQRRAG